MAILKIGSVKSTLTAMLERLERCQKSLNEFLEEKRSRYLCIFFTFLDQFLDQEAFSRKGCGRQLNSACSFHLIGQIPNSVNQMSLPLDRQNTKLLMTKN